MSMAKTKEMKRRARPRRASHKARRSGSAVPPVPPKIKRVLPAQTISLAATPGLAAALVLAGALPIKGNRP